MNTPATPAMSAGYQFPVRATRGLLLLLLQLLLFAVILCTQLLQAKSASAIQTDPPANSAPVTTETTAEATAHTRFFSEDPSTLPAQIGGKVTERYRFLIDLNQDGQIDMLLSEPAPQFGNAGGFFAVLLAENNGYREIGHIFLHPFAAAVEHDALGNVHSRIWAYHRGSSSRGILGYCEIHGDKLSAPQHIEITLSPVGETVGDALYKSLFGGPFRLKAEVSTTTSNSVSWKAMKQ